MKFCFSLLMFCFCVPAYSGDQNAFLKIDAAVNPPSATVGSNIEYTVNIYGDDLSGVETESLEMRELYLEDDPNGTPVYIVGSMAKDVSPTMIEIKIVIAFYRPGAWTLPEVKIYGADKIRVGYNVPNVNIEAVNEKGEFADLENPFDMGVNYRKFFLLFLLAAALCFFAFWIFKKFKNPKEETALPADPFDLFLSELDGLDGNKLLGEGRVDEYAFGVSIIFRRFLSRCFGFDAAEMTTGEIRASLLNILRLPAHAELLDDIIRQFDLWDLSKFAEFTPDELVMLRSHDDMIKTAKKLARNWNDGRVRF